MITAQRKDVVGITFRTIFDVIIFITIVIFILIILAFSLASVAFRWPHWFKKKSKRLWGVDTEDTTWLARIVNYWQLTVATVFSVLVWIAGTFLSHWLPPLMFPFLMYPLKLTFDTLTSCRWESCVIWRSSQLYTDNFNDHNLLAQTLVPSLI